MSEPKAPAPPEVFRAKPLVLALVIGGLGGWAASELELPLPWMIGAMGTTTLAAILGLEIAVPMRLRGVMVALLGLMLGSRFSPEILDRLADWALTLTMLAAYIAVAAGAGLLYFKRFARYDRITAYFSAMPGGLSEMVIVGTSMGGDGRIISLIHASRLLLVVLTLPFAFEILLGVELGARPLPGEPLLSLDLEAALLLGACGLVGALAAKAIRLPAALLVGPMVLSAVVHLVGLTDAEPPVELVAAAQVVIGAAIGARFARTAAALVFRTALIAAGATVVLVAVSLAFALGLHAATDLPLSALVLAYAPGGLAEMSLIALALALDAAFVATHHIIRICLIVLLAPSAYRALDGGAPPA